MDIKELAEQAGYMPDGFGIGHWDMPECKRFYELVRQDEREACAKVCDEHLLLGNKCAAAIRARGDKHD